MNIYLATDHRGHTIEKELIQNLKKYLDVNIITSQLPHSPEDDYVDFALDVLNRMDKSKDIAVVICGNGIGMSIIANKVRDIRCARVTTIDEAVAAREHNGANAIALGTTNISKMTKLILAFINTPLPTEARHLRRISKIIKYEHGEYNEL